MLGKIELENEETAFYNPDLENLEYQHEEIGKLRGLLGPEA